MATISGEYPGWDDGLTERSAEWVLSQLQAVEVSSADLQLEAGLRPADSLLGGSSTLAIDTDLSAVEGGCLRVLRLAVDMNPHLQRRVYELGNQTATQLINESEFSWINRCDARFSQWIEGDNWKTLLHGRDQPPEKLFEEPRWINLTLPQREGSTKSRVILMFDLWESSFEEKRRLLSQIKKCWSEISLSSEEFRWLKRRDHEQIQWAWLYLNERKKELFGQPALPESPIGADEIHLGILSFFDCWVGNKAERKLFLNRMKRAWSQKKYRSSLDGKVICNIVLKTETKNRLKELAEKSDLKMNEKLEHMINVEYGKLISGLS